MGCGGGVGEDKETLSFSRVGCQRDGGRPCRLKNNSPHPPALNKWEQSERTMQASAECPRCHHMFSLVGRSKIAIYCSKRCGDYIRNKKFRARHQEQVRISLHESYMRRQLKMTPLPYVDTACLPEEIS